VAHPLGKTPQRRITAGPFAFINRGAAPRRR
jgi:hypothetical protein